MTNDIKINPFFFLVNDMKINLVTPSCDGAVWCDVSLDVNVGDFSKGDSDNPKE
jgi:hypothetical protein